MYAIVKTGGKQYKVAPGDKICIEKMDAEPGSTIELPAICVVDGEKVEADPAKAAATKVLATVLEHYKGEKQLVFKFKKRKNYKKLRGHRQQLMRVHIDRRRLPPRRPTPSRPRLPRRRPRPRLRSRPRRRKRPRSLLPRRPRPRPPRRSRLPRSPRRRRPRPRRPTRSLLSSEGEGGTSWHIRRA